MSDIANHWRFALACAVQRIRTLVYDFDFETELSGHAAYVGITPESVVANIDGFLSERLPGGTVTELEQLRQQMLESIAPIYRSGEAEAHSIWTAASNDEERARLAQTPTNEVMLQAWQHVPVELSSSQANWFVEAFCYNWAQEWFAVEVAKLESELQ